MIKYALQLFGQQRSLQRSNDCTHRGPQHRQWNSLDVNHPSTEEIAPGPWADFLTSRDVINNTSEEIHVKSLAHPWFIVNSHYMIVNIIIIITHHSCFIDKETRWRPMEKWVNRVRTADCRTPRSRRECRLSVQFLPLFSDICKDKTTEKPAFWHLPGLIQALPHCVTTN